MSEAVLVREWGAEAFHHRVLEFETRGYIARRETYRITAEMNPETGKRRPGRAMCNHKIRNAEHGKIAAIYLLSAYCFEIPRHRGETWAKPRLTR